jgi:hypothetical protein
MQQQLSNHTYTSLKGTAYNLFLYPARWCARKIVPMMFVWQKIWLHKSPDRVSNTPCLFLAIERLFL